MEPFRILQIIPPATPVWAKFQVQDGYHYDPVDVWALVENSDGSREVQGMIAGPWMDTCETADNFIEYVKQIEDVNND